jgi:flagellar hook-basal body complex protein FliE
MSFEFPNYPTFPQIPGIPNIPSTDNSPAMPGGPAQASQNTTLSGTFNSFLQAASSDIKAPNQIARDMVSGKKPFDSSELMLSILEAEKKLSMTVRVINELATRLKEIERIQA